MKKGVRVYAVKMGETFGQGKYPKQYKDSININNPIRQFILDSVKEIEEENKEQKDKLEEEWRFQEVMRSFVEVKRSFIEASKDPDSPFYGKENEEIKCCCDYDEEAGGPCPGKFDKTYPGFFMNPNFSTAELTKYLVNYKCMKNFASYEIFMVHQINMGNEIKEKKELKKNPAFASFEQMGLMTAKECEELEKKYDQNTNMDNAWVKNSNTYESEKNSGQRDNKKIEKIEKRSKKKIVSGKKRGLLESTSNKVSKPPSKKRRHNNT